MDGNCIFLLVSVYVMKSRYERVQRKMHYNYRGLVFGAFRRMPDGLIYVWARESNILLYQTIHCICLTIRTIFWVETTVSGYFTFSIYLLIIFSHWYKLMFKSKLILRTGYPKEFLIYHYFFIQFCISMLI